MKKTLSMTPLLALVALAILPAVASAKKVDTTVTADEKAGIEIDCMSGTITVIGWDKDAVEVTGTVEPDDTEVTVDAGRRRIEITVDFPDSRKFRRSLSANLVIRMPRGGEVSAEGVNLSVDVSDVDGLVDLSTVNGVLTVGGNPDEIKLEAVNGTISVNGDCDDIDLESVSGSIEVRGGGGSVSAETVSGKIDLAVGTLREGDFSTVSGTVHIDGSLSPDAVVEVESHSGTVTLLLPRDVSALFHVETFTGAIESAFGRGEVDEEEFGLGKEMRLKVGGGDAEVNVTTFSGDVNIDRK